MTINSIGIFLVSLLALWLSTQLGSVVLGRRAVAQTEGGEDFRMILAATLSLLGLIIGFTLSMSIGGYNSRQAGEETEAATINTAYLRADLLPADSGVRLRSLLEQYLDKRLQFYRTENEAMRRTIRQETLAIQAGMWDTVRSAALTQQTPVVALAVASVNDVVSAQKKTQAGWRSQIPIAAWLLLVAIAVCCNILIGYNARNLKRKAGLLLILPVMISMSFMMIADIDVPGRGIIRVRPVNLEYLRDSLQSMKSAPATPVQG